MARPLLAPKYRQVGKGSPEASDVPPGAHEIVPGLLVGDRTFDDLSKEFGEPPLKPNALDPNTRAVAKIKLKRKAKKKR